MFGALSFTGQQIGRMNFDPKVSGGSSGRGITNTKKEHSEVSVNRKYGMFLKLKDPF